MEPLHEHNQKTYENVCRMYDEGIQRVAVVQPTGSGKSLLMAKLIEDNPDSRFFVLSTSHKINDQFKEKLDEEMLERSDFNIYCNMPNMKQEMMESLQPDYIFLDEMHRALAKEWSKGINVLLNMYPDAKVLGLSATPIRYLDKCRNVAEELFGGNLACDMSLSQAILDGILPMARYVCGVYSYEKDTESLNKKIEKSCNSDEEKKELLKELKILKENLDKGHGVSDIFKKYVVSGNEKFVVFLKNTTHLGIMKPVIEKWFLDAGFDVRLYEVHSKNTDKDKEFQAFKEDTEDGIKLCLSVNMLAEGIHGDIDGVIMLRETISANMYFQMIGRAFACGKKTIPLIFDLVANSQFISDAADNFPNELKRDIEKRKEEYKKEGKNYEVGFDVDEFIVMDEFMDVISGFKAIEGKLRDDWDAMFQEYCKFYKENGHGDVPKTEEYRKLNVWCQNQRQDLNNGILKENRRVLLVENGFIWDVLKYRFENNIRALEQYKEREGNCLVPNNHVEVVNGINVSLGNWCQTMRSAKKGKGKTFFTKKVEEQLERLGFIWDVKLTNFVNNVKAVANYYKKYESFPNKRSENLQEKQWGAFWSAERHKMSKVNYPEWKMKIINKYLPQFSYIKNDYEFFSTFISYAKLFRKQKNHLNIKYNDIINGYTIGKKLKYLRELYNQNKLSKDKIDKLLELGIDLRSGKEIQYEKKIRIAKDAVDNGFVVTYSNQKYKGMNLYEWIKWNVKNRVDVLNDNERDIIEKLTGKSLSNIFQYNKPILVVDIIENRKIGKYDSQSKAAKDIQKIYGYKISATVIGNCVNNIQKSPYKGRFMFYYATDEEIKKYLEESKVS